MVVFDAKISQKPHIPEVVWNPLKTLLGMVFFVFQLNI